MPRLAVTVDEPVMLFDDGVDHGEPEPGPLPKILGGEKRLEDPVPRFFIHADTRVGDGHHRIAPDLAIAVRRNEFRVQPDRLRGDPQHTALRHGIARVDHQVHDDLLYLPRIGHDG